MNKIDLSDYYLDFKSLQLLDEKTHKEVLILYRDMLEFCERGQYIQARGYLNTLKMNGFLRNLTQESRDTKITELMNENV